MKERNILVGRKDAVSEVTMIGTPREIGMLIEDADGTVRKRKREEKNLELHSETRGRGTRVNERKKRKNTQSPSFIGSAD